jgi:hypothetical protein
VEIMNGDMRIKPDFIEVLLSTYVYKNETPLSSVIINKVNTALTSAKLVILQRHPEEISIATITMTFSEFVKDQRKPLPLAPTPSGCKGATFIVTGANTGLGFEAAKHLVALSSSRVILGVRNLKKGEEAKAKIEVETGIKGVAEVWHLDLTSSDSVKEFAKKVEGLERVDAVIENAGVAMGEWTSAEGLETSLTVNDVSTLLLAVLVLPKLQESGRKFGVQPHLVVVGSAVAFGAEGELERIDEEGDILEGLNQPMAMGKR